jgi:hypothetical protein
VRLEPLEVLMAIRIDVEDLGDLWQRIPEAEAPSTVVMEPTRNTWFHWRSDVDATAPGC